MNLKASQSTPCLGLTSERSRLCQTASCLPPPSWSLHSNSRAPNAKPALGKASVGSRPCLKRYVRNWNSLNWSQCRHLSVQGTIMASSYGAEHIQSCLRQMLKMALSHQPYSSRYKPEFTRLIWVWNQVNLAYRRLGELHVRQCGIIGIYKHEASPPQPACIYIRKETIVLFVHEEQSTYMAPESGWVMPCVIVCQGKSWACQTQHRIDCALMRDTQYRGRQMWSCMRAYSCCNTEARIVQAWWPQMGSVFMSTKRTGLYEMFLAPRLPSIPFKVTAQAISITHESNFMVLSLKSSRTRSLGGNPFNKDSTMSRSKYAVLPMSILSYLASRCVQGGLDFRCNTPA